MKKGGGWGRNYYNKEVRLNHASLTELGGMNAIDARKQTITDVHQEKEERIYVFKYVIHYCV